MKLETPEGVLTIEDDRLTVDYWDDAPTLTVSLSPVPDYRFERGLYGLGTLVVGDATVTIGNDQAEAVVVELRRPRGGKAAKSAKADDAK